MWASLGYWALFGFSLSVLLGHLLAGYAPIRFGVFLIVLGLVAACGISFVLSIMKLRSVKGNDAKPIDYKMSLLPPALLLIVILVALVPGGMTV